MILGRIFYVFRQLLASGLKILVIKGATESRLTEFVALISNLASSPVHFLYGKIWPDLNIIKNFLWQFSKSVANLIVPSVGESNFSQSRHVRLSNVFPNHIWKVIFGALSRIFISAEIHPSSFSNFISSKEVQSANSRFSAT